jgi:hypothetical protein
MAATELSPAALERRRLLWLLALTALAARLPLLLGAPGAGFDLESYRLAAERVTGEGLYTHPLLQGRYPYLPAWWMLLRLCHAAAGWLNLPFERVLRLPALLADLGLSLLIFQLLERMGRAPQPPLGQGWRSPAFWGALAWAANPLPAMVGAGHGQFDSLPLFFVALAAWYLELSASKRSESWAALCLGAAIALKSWPAALLPLFLKMFLERREMLRFALGTLALPALLSLPWLLMDGPSAMAQRLAYGGSSALSLPEALRAAAFAMGADARAYQALKSGLSLAGLGAIAGLGLAYLLGRWRFQLLPGLGLGALTLLVFAPGLSMQYLGLSMQYLCWPAALSLLSPGPFARRFVGLGLAAALAGYLFLLPETLLGPAAWPAPPRSEGVLLLWAGLNLGLWMLLLVEWVRQLAWCRSASGRA